MSTFVFFAVGSIACVETPPSQMQVVGPLGGTVQLQDVTLTVPPGAVDKVVNVEIAPVTVGKNNAVGQAFLLGPEDVTFKKPVTLTLPFDAAKLPKGMDASAVKVFTAQRGSTEFSSMNAAAVDANHVQVETTHFSVWYAGVPEANPLISNLNFPNAVASDGASLYWVDQGTPGTTNTGRVMKASLDGMAVIVAEGQVDPKGIALDATHVYWTTGGSPAAMVAGTVMRAPIGGGAAEMLAGGLSFPRAIAVDGTAVYFSDHDDGKVYSIALDTKALTTLAEGQGKVDGIALDATDVYFTSRTNGQVLKVAKTGGTPVALASAQAAPSGLTLDGDTVYWANGSQNLDAKGVAVSNGTGSIAKVAKAGGTPVELATNQAKPAALITDGTDVYWVNSGNGTVNKVPLAGGSSTVLAGSQEVTMGIVAQGGTLYILNNGDAVSRGNIATVPK